jgi:hypothetical protein
LYQFQMFPFQYPISGILESLFAATTNKTGNWFFKDKEPTNVQCQKETCPPFPAAYRKASEIIDKGTVDECWIVVDIVLLKYEDFFFDRRIYGMIRIDISYRTQLEITCQDGQDCKNCIVGFRGFMGWITESIHAW